MNKLQPNTSTTFATPPAAVATPTSQCVRCQGLINEHCRCTCGYADPDVGSGGDAPIDVTDPWRGLYRSEHLRANGDGDLYHPDMPSWPDDREDALDKLVHAQGFDFQVVAGDFSDEAIEDGGELYWQEMRAWNPEAPEGDWRLAWKGDTEDGPYAWFVRPMALRPDPEDIAASQPVGFDFLTHLQRQREWSARTFGPGDRATGVVDHIRKELREIESDPGDLTEWIDVAILALDGAWRSGASAEQIIAALVAKQTRNEGRTWPDWRTADPSKAIEHDRSGEAPPAPAAVPVDVPDIPYPTQECYSDSEGDYWADHPADCEFVQGLTVGDVFELTVSHYGVTRQYIVTKAPDENSDDYEVEPVATHPQPAAAKDGDA